MVTGKYSPRVEDILSVVATSVPHHCHPLPHQCPVALHVDIEAHRFWPSCRGAAGFTIVRPWWSGQYDQLLGPSTTQIQPAGVEQQNEPSQAECVEECPLQAAWRSWCFTGAHDGQTDVGGSRTDR